MLLSTINAAKIHQNTEDTNCFLKNKRQKALLTYFLQKGKSKKKSHETQIESLQCSYKHICSDVLFFCS